jgi:predicted permease
LDDSRGEPSMMTNLRLALRVLAKEPGFTATAVTTLALAIGANTAVFSLIDGVLLSSLPVREPRELVFLKKVGASDPYPDFSYPLFDRLRASQAATLAAASRIARYHASIDGRAAESARGQLVSCEFFSTLGVHAIVGRVLEPGDEVAPGLPVAVLSHAYWQRRFAQDPQILGRALSVNGVILTVVGVAAPEFFGVQVGDVPDFWAPLTMQAAIRYSQDVWSNGGRTEDPWIPQEDIHWLILIGRVSAPERLESALARLNVVYRRQPDGLGGSVRIAALPAGKGLDHLRRRFSQPLSLLMAMVGLFLLIACANVANLMLARAHGRRREIAVRLSIGASRGRIVRQLLAESLVLASLGGALGSLAAVWGTKSLLLVLGAGAPLLPVEVRPNLHLLAFAVILTTTTASLFGLVPAIHGTRFEPWQALKSGSRSTGLGRGRDFGTLLVVTQVALSLVLLFGAALFARSLRNLTRVAPGFDLENVLTVRMDPRAAGYPPSQLPGLYRRLIERVRAEPGVRSASVSLGGLASGVVRTSGIAAEGYVPRVGERSDAQENLVGPDYFATVGMPILRGRAFDARDSESSPRVVIINETMARHFFPGQDPIGRHLGYSPGRLDFEVVGIVRDAKVNNLREPPPRMAFRPVFQEPEYLQSLDVRTGGRAAAVEAAIRAAAADVDPDLPILGASTLAEQVGGTMTQETLLARLTGLLGILAVALACLGLYGIASYAVVRRTTEIGIRMALGAPSSSVRRLMLGRTLTLVLIGLVLGLPLALAFGRAVASQLFGLTATDPLALAGAVFLLVAVAALAADIPARRASQLDPVTALRSE